MPIHFDVEGAVANIVIDGYNHLNPLNYEMYAELDSRLSEIDARPGIKVAVLTGAGGQHFSAGHDVKSATQQMESGEDREVYSVRPYWFREANDVAAIMRRRTLTPVIGATQGWCMAAATVIYCLHTSIRIAGESSKFGLSELKLALATASSMARMQEQLPYATLMWMAATGEHIDAATALRTGFVNEIVPDEQVVERAREVADMIAVAPRLSVRAEKSSLFRGEGASLGGATAFASAAAALNRFDAETVEGIRESVADEKEG